MKNKYDLDRRIPDEIKRIVRQRCGFGCCICGTAIIEYHHFDPEFNEAKEHNPDGITLLCSTCHSKATKRLIDLDFVIKANANPKCHQQGFTKDIFYVGNKAITFKLGSASFKREAVIIYDNEPLIYFYPPEEEGGPLRLNAKLYDDSGMELLKIIENEWIAGTDHFDIETVGNAIIIREKLGQIKLKLTSVSEKEINVEKIDMFYKGFKIQVLGGNFIVKTPQGGTIQLQCPNIFATLVLGSDGSFRL